MAKSKRIDKNQGINGIKCGSFISESDRVEKKRRTNSAIREKPIDKT
jgi:hypothetical protein